MYLTEDSLSDLNLDSLLGVVDNATGGLITNTGQDLIDKGANELGITGETRSIVDQGLEIGKSLLTGGGNSSSSGGSSQSSSPPTPPTQSPPELPPETVQTINRIVDNNTTESASPPIMQESSSMAPMQTATGFFKRIPPVGYGLLGGAVVYGITKRLGISAMATVATALLGIQIQRRV